MMGPMTYGRHLLSTPRLPFTVAYFGSIGFTLYFSLGVSRSTFLSYPCLLLSRKWRICPSLGENFRGNQLTFFFYRLAEKHLVDPVLGYRAAGLSALVPHQLLPHGLERTAPRYYVWCPESCGVGVWLSEGNGDEEESESDNFAAGVSEACIERWRGPYTTCTVRYLHNYVLSVYISFLYIMRRRDVHSIILSPPPPSLSSPFK